MLIALLGPAAARNGGYPCTQKEKTALRKSPFLDLDDTTLQLRFTDKTTLSFDLEPGLTVRTLLYDGEVDNELPAKIWPVLNRASSWVKEPAGRTTKSYH